MAYYQAILLVFFSLILAIIQPSDGVFIKGSVTCLDCDGQFHLTGIKVSVKCSKVKKLGMATTAEDGSFETELPNSSSSSPQTQTSLKCFAKILGGPTLLYSKSNNIGSKVVKIQGQDFYTNSEPLNFYKSCPAAKCAATSSSKTVDLPLPKEWGLPPTSYYVPFIPIIGIP